MQPNVSLRELVEKYSTARGEIIRLVVQEKEQQEANAKRAATITEASLPARKKARIDPVAAVKTETVAAPRRSSRRSAAGRAKEAAKQIAAGKDTDGGGGGSRVDAVVLEDDEFLPGPSTRSTRNRAHTSDLKPSPTDEPKTDDDDCIEILSDEEEEEEEKSEDEEKVKEERSVDHDEDFDLTLEEEEHEENEEADDDDEFSPSPPLKKKHRSSNSQQQRHPPPASAAGGSSGSKPIAAPGAVAGTPQGFVPCPICAKSVPSFYINSHVDSCLNSGGGGGGSGGFASGSEGQDGLPTSTTTKNTTDLPQPIPPPPLQTLNPKSNLVPKPQPGPYIPLIVPPCLVPALATDKTIRTALKKYSLPTDGKKSEMFDRYSQFRFAVLTANDRQERTSYNKIAQRVVALERQRAAAALLGGGGSGSGRNISSGKLGGNNTLSSSLNRTLINQKINKTNKSKQRTGDPTVLQGDSFEELIAVTKARDAARRAARSAAAAEQEKEEEDKRKVDTTLPSVDLDADVDAEAGFVDEKEEQEEGKNADGNGDEEQQPSRERSPSPAWNRPISPVYVPTSPAYLRQSPSPQYVPCPEDADAAGAAPTATAPGATFAEALPSPIYRAPSPVYTPCSPITKPIQKDENSENPENAAPVVNNNKSESTREEMLAEEVRQAHEIGLLDSDDDNW